MKKFIKKLAVVLLGLGCLGCVAGAYTFIKQSYIVSSASAVLEGAETLQNEYQVGTLLTIPEGTIKIDGQELIAETFVTLPDGNVSSQRSMLLKQSGLYLVEYKAEYNGERFSVQKQFTVLEPSYSVAGETSTLAYGAYERYPAVDGLCVDLAQGDTFSYNKIIDLTGRTKADPLLRLNITPLQAGIGDAQMISFTFTDVYNKNNYVSVQVKMDTQQDYYGLGTYAPRVYVMAKANDQAPTGLQKNSKGSYEYKGEKYTIQSNNNFGALISGVCFAGQNALSATEIITYEDGGKEFGIAFDYEEKAVYLYRAEGNISFLIADLDDENVFGEKNIWEGFTTGEAFLSISADRYVSEKFSFVLRDINGDNLQNGVSDFDYTTKLTVNDGGIEYPEAVVGKSYPVYDATAYHVAQGELPVQTCVYFAYETEACFELPIKDGKFTPVAEGIYTVEYAAVDKFGERTVKLVKIWAKATSAGLTVSLGNIPGNSYSVGELVPVAMPTYHSSYASFGLQKEILAKEKSGLATYKIEDGFTFRPLYAGTYEICYVCEDFVERVEEKYEIEVKANGAPIITEKIYAPSYVIKNTKYCFENVFGYLFENGKPVKAQAVLSVQEFAEKNGSISANVPVTDYYTVGDCKYIRLQYSIEGTSVLSDYISVVDAGFGDKLDMAKYFIATQGEFGVEKASGSLTFSTNPEKAENGRVQFDFINRVLSNEFGLDFSNAQTEKGGKEYEKFDIILTDYYDETLSLKFSYAPTEDGFDFYLNDVYKASVADSTTFSLVYENAGAVIKPQKGTSVNVYEDLNGEKFHGFSSGYIRVSFAFTGVKGESSLKIKKIGNQAFDGTTVDYMKPMMHILGEKQSYKVGDIAVIPNIYCVDMLDPYVDLSFTVKTPNGAIAQSTEGVLLENVTQLDKEYAISIEQYGIYYIEYTAMDTTGRTNSLTYSLSVPDVTPPTVILTDKTLKAKKGSVVKIATAEIVDNSSQGEDLKVFIALNSPDGLMTELSDTTFKAQKKGKYTVYYHVTDESGNTTIVHYTITIE